MKNWGLLQILEPNRLGLIFEKNINEKSRGFLKKKRVLVLMSRVGKAELEQIYREQIIRAEENMYFFIVSK